MKSLKRETILESFWEVDLSHGYDIDIRKDILVKAHYKVEGILAGDDLYEIEFYKAKQIDDILKKAEKDLI